MKKKKHTQCLKVMQGKVEKVYFSGPTFSAGVMRTDTKHLVSFAGAFYAQKGGYYSLTGSWRNHPKYGRQFQVKSMNYDIRLDKEGLIHYLANNPEIKGIGPVKAKKMVTLFGDDFDEALKLRRDDIAMTVKIKREVVDRLADYWFTTRQFAETKTWLARFELTHIQITRLIEKLGNNALPILQKDPFIIMREFPGYGFSRVDEIARKLGMEKEAPSRIRAGVMHLIFEAAKRGSCWIDFYDLIDQANAILIMDVLHSKSLIEQQLEILIELGQLACSAYLHQFLVGKPSLHEAEKALYAFFKSSSRKNPFFHQALAKSLIPDKATLTEDQEKAIKTALKMAVSLISGAGGTGKTHMLSVLNQIYVNRGLKVMLCAPTGKAAKRLSEATSSPAFTIHKLLGFNGKSFERTTALETDLLVVDEFSMVDSFLAAKLFEFTGPETAIVLVGDHNQLPPVGPGNPLRDIIQFNAIPTTILKTVVRQSGSLMRNSQDILRGKVWPTTEGKEEPLPWYVFNQFTKPEALKRALIRLFNETLSDKFGFDLIRDVQVLTPTHKGPIGTRELNKALQRIIQFKCFGIDVSGRFCKNDKVIQKTNDYDLDVMNGAIGFVVGVSSNGDLSIEFDGHLVQIERDSKEYWNLDLAYALTIHKFQGAEARCAMVIAHKSHAFMHHRNLLYTGVTRGSHTTIIIGDAWGIRNCAAVQKLDDRRTLLPLMWQDDIARREGIPYKRNLEKPRVANNFGK